MHLFEDFAQIYNFREAVALKKPKRLRVRQNTEQLVKNLSDTPIPLILVLVLLMLRVIVANYSKEVLNTNVSQELVESAGRASNPPEFVRVNECSRTVR